MFRKTLSDLLDGGVKNSLMNDRRLNYADDMVMLSDDQPLSPQALDHMVI